MRMNIRLRMTFWYGTVLAAVLATFGVSVYLMMRHQLRARTDAGLAQALVEIMEEVEEARNEARLKERLQRRFVARESYDFQVINVDGRVVFRSDRLSAETLPVPPIPSSLKRLDFETVPLGSRTVESPFLGRVRVASELVPGPESTVVVQAAASLASDDHELSELLLVLLLAGPLALAFALGGGYLLARKALAPVDRMARTADEITAARLDRRLTVANPDDELGRLARTLNDMIGRLESSFEEIRRFTADAAHELRTPLTVLRTEAEVALRHPREPEQYRQVIETMLEEVERLTRLSEQLLFLCREDAGLAPRIQNPVRLDRVVNDACDHMRVVAEARGVALRLAPLEPWTVVGDGDQLRRLLFNLLDNAIKFTPAGGTVSVWGGRVDERYRIVVSDTGIGIAAEHIPNIFKRFYRADPARGQEASGTGLGLAISRSIADAFGAELRVESTPGEGTEVSLIVAGTAPPYGPSAMPDSASAGGSFVAARADECGIRRGGVHANVESP